MNRLATNMQILQSIKELLEADPSQRFEQALINLGLKYPSFFKESDETYETVKEFYNHLLNEQ